MRTARRGYPLPATILAVLCGCTEPVAPGSVAIFATSQLGEPGFFVYEIALDGGSPRRLTSFDSTSWIVNGLAAGPHTVRLGGQLPQSCDAGQRERRVILKGGDTAVVRFDIRCPRTTGDLRLTVVTSGQAGAGMYGVVLDSVAGGAIAPNGTMLIRYLAPGTRRVRLLVPTNCTAPPPEPVTIVAGAEAALTLTVTCERPALVRFVSGFSGEDQDPDGIAIRVDDGVTERLVVGTTTRTVASGVHAYSISDLQPNCAIGAAPTGTFTAIPAETVTVSLTATCKAVPQGVAAFTVTDNVSDTLPNTAAQPAPAHDIRSVTGLYAPGWLILVMRFGGPVSAPQSTSSTGRVYGSIDLDLDENVATGSRPLMNAFGGTASQGVDAAVAISTAGTSAFVFGSSVTLSGARVLTRFAGDSLTVYIPLAKFADDGNMTITSIIGTLDRPTDWVPNSGTIVARAPAGMVLDVVALPQRGSDMFQGRESSRPVVPGGWRSP